MPDERPPAARALLISESPEHARMLEGALSALDGWDWVRVGQRSEAAALLRLKPFTAVLADTDDSGWDASEADALKTAAGSSPLLFLGRKSRGGGPGLWIDWEHLSYAKLASALASLDGQNGGVRSAWDPVTGFPAERLFLEQAGKACALALRHRKGAAVLVLRFEGPEAASVGPQAWFREAAARLRACLKEDDLAGRTADGELSFLLPGADRPEPVSAIGRRMLESLRALAVQHPGALRPSVGMTFLSQSHSTIAELLEAARRGVVRSTALGGDCLHFDEPRLDDEAAARFRYEVELRRGMAEGQFTVHWQPQASLDGRVNRAEALLRWLHPSRGLVPPSEFIPFCEACGLIQPLFDWMLRRVLTAAVELDALLPGFKVMVKLSLWQLQDPGIIEQVRDNLARADCPGRRLCLDVTGSSALAAWDGAADVLGDLRALGPEVALDDFGGLCSPVGWLKRLPLDLIKLDSNLVAELDRLEDDQRIAEWMVSLSHQMGLMVLAEGVERLSQLEVLRPMAPDLYQGDLLARPQPLEGFKLWLKEAGLESALRPSGRP